MTLGNLAKIGRLKAHKATREEVARLLSAARRNLRDARVTSISTETRFDAAYKAAMQCALVAMMAHGYRPSTNEPGHHAIVIQSLSTTLGLANDRWIVLDKLRRLRNRGDYTGEEVSRQEAASCIRAAESLLEALTAWLRVNRAELVTPDD